MTCFQLAWNDNKNGDFLKCQWFHSARCGYYQYFVSAILVPGHGGHIEWIGYTNDKCWATGYIFGFWKSVGTTIDICQTANICLCECFNESNMGLVRKEIAKTKMGVRQRARWAESNQLNERSIPIFLVITCIQRWTMCYIKIFVRPSDILRTIERNEHTYIHNCQWKTYIFRMRFICAWCRCRRRRPAPAPKKLIHCKNFETHAIFTIIHFHGKRVHRSSEIKKKPGDNDKDQKITKPV